MVVSNFAAVTGFGRFSRPTLTFPNTLNSMVFASSPLAGLAPSVTQTTENHEPCFFTLTALERHPPSKDKRLVISAERCWQQYTASHVG